MPSLPSTGHAPNWSRCRSAWLVLSAAAAGLWLQPVRAAEEVRAADLPEKYTLDYPPAADFCAPVATFFDEVVRSFEVVRGHKFTHQPNGGYGLPIVLQVDGQNLIHVGADVGWHRAGAAVYAVAAGVVRVSEGPPPPGKTKPGDGGRADDVPEPRPSVKGTAWGNLIVIEHRLPDATYMTTIYGHLASKRLVKQGDLVQVGQQIGTIGAKHVAINGGYTPHLHFGMRRGRLAEPGCTLLELTRAGLRASVKLVTVSEDEIEVEMSPDKFDVPEIRLAIGSGQADRRYPVTVRDGKSFVSARMLWEIRNRPGFETVGNSLSTEGWLDPVAVLRQCGADRRRP